MCVHTAVRCTRARNQVARRHGSVDRVGRNKRAACSPDRGARTRAVNAAPPSTRRSSFAQSLAAALCASRPHAPRRPHAPLPLSLATALDSARRFAVQPMRPNEDGASAVRSRGPNTSAALSRRTHPRPWCMALCAFWHRTALPKNRESRVRAIPRATPPVPHAPVPCAPLAVRFASRRGVGGDDGRSLRLSTSPASSEALEGPAEAERRRLPHVLALAGRRSRPDAAARPLTRHALPARPPI